MTSLIHPVVVSENPADITPHVVIGGGSNNVYAFEQIGSTMFAGGRFNEVQDPVMTTTYTRNNFVAFDAETGVISPFNLSFDGMVTDIEASEDETALYISGAFSDVNGITRRGIMKYDLVNNQVDPTFAPTGMRTVSNIELVNGYLIAAGNFDKHLMAMDLTTGADLGIIDVEFSGVVDQTDETRVRRLAVSPDGTKLVGTGNFANVNGQSQRMAFMLNLGSPATLSNWYAPRFDVDCPANNRLPAQGVDFSPDGSYFVIVTTGAKNNNGLCDAAARFETADESDDVEPTWINWTGGDTLYSVAITGPAVYVGGHQRWLDNPFGSDTAGPGAVSRPGIAAIDPVSGMALDWNPTKSRNHGTMVLFPTPDGLWVGSDGEHFGSEDHVGIGFAPLDLSPTPDTIRPNTFIDSGPSGSVSDTSATFSFSADESSVFQCRLDGAAFAPCTSPLTYEDLSDGSHTFQVVAVDDSYNMDSTPAEQLWDVVAVGTELVGNPGFEVDTSGWTGDASSNTLTRVSGGHSGGWAVQVSNSVAGAKCGIDDSPSWVSSTEYPSYTASIWARSDNPGATLKLRVREYLDGSHLGTVTENMTLTSSWQQVTANYATVAMGSSLDYEVYTSNSPTGVCFQADDASMTLDDGPPPPAVMISGTVNVAEGGATDSYSMVLATIPTADVNVTITPDDQTDLGSGAGNSIVRTFTPANALSPQTVTVTAVDDLVTEGLHSSTITHSSSSADTDYDGLTINNIVASISDNDAPGVTITKSTTDVTEGGAIDSYAVVLNTVPTTNVNVTVTPDSQIDLGSGAGNSIVLTFTPANALSPQTVNVTAVDDSVVEGPHSGTITHGSSSADTNYNGLTINNVVANVSDNDVAGVTITQSGGTTDVTEGGAGDSYTVVLDAEPTADVAVTLATDGQSVASTSPVTGTILAADFDTNEDAFGYFDDSFRGTNAPGYATGTRLPSGGFSGGGLQVSLGGVDDATVLGMSGGWQRSFTLNEPTDVTFSFRYNLTLAANYESDEFSQALVSMDGVLYGNGNDYVAQLVGDGNGGSAQSTGWQTFEFTPGTLSAGTHTLAIGAYNNKKTLNDETTQLLIDDVLGSAELSSALLFTPANWNVAQTVTVAAVDDAVGEGPHTSTIVHTSSSQDPNFNGMTIQSVVANVADNDASVIITQSGGTTDVTEGGATDSYTVVLDMIPAANVNVTVTPDSQTDLGGGVGNSIVLTFTPANALSPQTVNVTAFDDALVEGPHSSTITHSSSSADSNYQGLTISDVVASVSDNDAPGVTITQSGGTTDVTEGGAADSYTVVLDTVPTNNVNVTVNPDNQTDLGNGAGNSIVLTFTPANALSPQTVNVTAFDDGVVEGPHSSTITHGSSSADTNYQGLAINNVVANVSDNDAAGVTITQSGGTTDVTEGGTTDTYTVVLDAEPTANVTVTMTPDGQSVASATAGGNETILSADFDADEDAFGYVDDSFRGTNEPGYATGTRLPSGGFSGGGLQVSLGGVNDADIFGMSGGWQRSFTLNEPTDVTFSFRYNLTLAANYESDEFSQALVSMDGVLYGNGPNDYIAQLVGDGNGGSAQSTGWQTFEFTPGTLSAGTHTLAIGAYNNQKTLDDESSQLLIDDVLGSAELSSALLFTPANWNVAKTVTVAAVDDAVSEGPHTSTIVHTSSSQDPNFNGLTIQSVVANITDNEPSILITQSGGTTDVTEGGAVDSYTVVLETIPGADVSVTVTPDGQTDLGNGAGNSILLTFTPANALNPQTVNVTAFDDAVIEGPHSSSITHATSSADLGYHGLAIDDVIVNITDNDAGGVTINQSGGSTDVTEGGATDSYTVVLDTVPASNVNVTVTPDSQTDLGNGTGNSIVLTFTPGNAFTPQLVVVTAVDDAIEEGPHTSTITHSAASSDSIYDGLPISNVVVNVTDNDTTAETILYLSFDSTATLPGGLTVKNEDVVSFDGTDFNIVFDGSDVGISGTNVDALAVISATEILFSFSTTETIPGIAGTVEDSDIVKFTATQLGDTTSGTFALFFRGDDVGLAPGTEDIVAIDLLDDGRLLVSTKASYSVPGVSGRDEDLIAFTPNTPGDYFAGTWAIYFDGSDVELGSEDVNAVSVDSFGDIHLSTTGTLNVTGISGENEDLFVFMPAQLGADTTGAFVSTPLFDGSQFGLSANDVNGFDVSTPAGGGAGDALQITQRPAVAAQLFAVEEYAPKYDVSGNGEVTALDALQVVNSVAVLNSGTLTDRQIDDLDVNEDGTLSALDALLVINYLSRGSVAQSESIVLAVPTISQPDPDESRDRAIQELMDESQFGVPAKDLF